MSKMKCYVKYWRSYIMREIKEIAAFIIDEVDGCLEYAKAAVFGRVLIKNDSFITLEDAVKRALGDLPFVLDADIGHVKPTMTLINGAFAVLNVKGQGGSLEMKLI